MKQNILITIFSALTLACASCADSDNNGTNSGESAQKPVVILYDNDVHCKVDGYTKIAGLRNAINATDTAECIIVSSGDFLQGGAYGAISQGQDIVDIMNACDYSAVTIGNHEFDYQVPRMLEVLGKLSAKVVCSNFSAPGAEMYFPAYTMKTVAGKKFAFVGVATPITLKMERYACFDASGKQIVDFYPNQMAQLVQQATDKARSEGADYVICLSHLGEMTGNDYTSINLINQVQGIDYVLDGHTHSVIADSTAIDATGKAIHFTQTGTQFANIGKLLVKEGQCSSTLIPISEITYTDPNVDSAMQKTQAAEQVNVVLGTSAYTLTINGDDGKRLIRKGETNLGDFVTDAYRWCTGAQVALCNGGGIRTSLASGSITRGNFIDINPFYNDLEVKEIKGHQLQAMLEESYANMPNEDGQFLHISGIRCIIDLTGATPAVRDLQVLDTATGTYTDIDPEATYSVATSHYVFSCHETCLDGAKDITQQHLLDANTLETYFTEAFGGVMPEKYAKAEGRISCRK